MIRAPEPSRREPSKAIPRHFRDTPRRADGQNYSQAQADILADLDHDRAMEERL